MSDQKRKTGAGTAANTGGLGVGLSAKWFWKCPTCKKSGIETAQAAALEKMYGDARGRGKHCEQKHACSADSKD